MLPSMPSAMKQDPGQMRSPKMLGESRGRGGRRIQPDDLHPNGEAQSQFFRTRG